MTENRSEKTEAEKKAIAERLIREQTIKRLIKWGSAGIDSEYDWRKEPDTYKDGKRSDR